MAMTAGPEPEPDRPATHRSFRDPSGCLAAVDGRIVRAVNRAGRDDYEAFTTSASGQRLLAAGDVVSTRSLSLSESGNDALARELFGCQPSVLLEHERIAFPSYPYEWPVEMLHAAGRLTLRIARALLDDGLGLKDATPFNVLFAGPRPVFVDLLSFERREAGDPIWLAEAQCISTFLLPLLLYRHHRIAPHQHFVGRRDGISPEDVYALTGPLRRVTPSFLRWVSLPTLLGGGGERPHRPARRPQDPAKSRFILRHLLGQLDRSLARLEPGGRRHSVWSRYESCTHYDETAAAAKEAFVTECLTRLAPARVLDVGCNVGRFTRLAARAGATVVAVDLDPVVVGAVWKMASAEHLDVLPLVQNLAMPSPATGWRNRECPSFLERATGAFEMVFLLAVVHHLLVSDRIPLGELVDLAAELSTQAVVVEYVGPDDDMFRRIAKGREDLHADLCPASFEAAWQRRFALADAKPVPGTGRRMYLFVKP